MKKTFLTTFFIIFFCTATFADSWFDGLPQAGIDWLKTQAKHPGTFWKHNIQSKTFGNYTIFIDFAEDTSGPTWEQIRKYWVKIVDNSTGKFVSGVPRDFKTQSAILSELNSATSLEQLLAIKAAEEQYKLSMRPFSTFESGENKAPLVSSETPIASADKAGLRLMQNILTPQIEPKEKQEKQTGKIRAIGGTITYEDFEYYETDGNYYEIFTGIEEDFEKFTAGIYMPVSYVDIDSGNWTRLGLTGYIKKDFYKNDLKFSLGINTGFEKTWMDVSGIDDSIAYGIGTMASVEYDSKNINIKFGSNIQYMDNDEYDSISILTTGINIGIPIGKNFAFNVYTYRNDNLDSPNDYYIVGGTIEYVVNDTFGLNLGINTVTSYDEYDSVSYYLGSTWRF